MCLGIPAQIIEIEGDTATVSYGSLTGYASVALVPDVNIGDYVIIHAGFAIETVEPSEAKETLRLLREIGEVR
jgi:hydrogenase expression/formation protein HypC